MGKLLVPFRVSTGKRGIAVRGTQAFVWQGTDIPTWVKEDLKRVKLRLSEVRRLEASGQYRKGYFSRPFAELDSAAERIALERRKIAENSDFFIKMTTPQRERIRQLLHSHGIPIEMPMEDLRNGLLLFASGKFRQISEHLKNAEAVKKQILGILTKMHALGVSHNHLHFGNFVIGPEERIRLLDLSRAKYFASKPRDKKQFLQRFASDIFFVAREFAWLGEHYSLPNENERLRANIRKECQRILSACPQNFSSTPEDIRQEVNAQQRIATDKRVKKMIERGEV